MKESEASTILKAEIVHHPECSIFAEALGLAIQALEKQIPKKPIFANNMMTKDKFLMCPCCEFRFPDSLVFLKTRCWNCGQKLDWSDEE